MSEDYPSCPWPLDVHSVERIYERTHKWIESWLDTPHLRYFYDNGGFRAAMFNGHSGYHDAYGVYYHTADSDGVHFGRRHPYPEIHLRYTWSKVNKIAAEMIGGQEVLF